MSRLLSGVCLRPSPGNLLPTLADTDRHTVAN